MSNEISMSRELAELCFRSLNGGDNQLTGTEHGQAFRELRALLAKPADERQGEPMAMNRGQFEAWVLGREHPTYGWLDKYWLAHGDNPENYADPYVQGLWVASQSLHDEQPAQKYDDTLLPFLALMRKELHANSHKGDRPEWLKMTASTALEEIAHHFNKLDEAVGARDNPQIREYAADIANICMMLLDICGELAFVEQPEPVSSSSDKYKAELYDEVWQLARGMGFGNVTDALMKLQGNKTR